MTRRLRLFRLRSWWVSLPETRSLSALHLRQPVTRQRRNGSAYPAGPPCDAILSDLGLPLGCPPTTPDVSNSNNDRIFHIQSRAALGVSAVERPRRAWSRR